MQQQPPRSRLRPFAACVALQQPQVVEEFRPSLVLQQHPPPDVLQPQADKGRGGRRSTTSAIPTAVRWKIELRLAVNIVLIREGMFRRYSRHRRPSRRDFTPTSEGGDFGREPPSRQPQLGRHYRRVATEGAPPLPQGVEIRRDNTALSALGSPRRLRTEGADECGADRERSHTDTRDKPVRNRT